MSSGCVSKDFPLYHSNLIATYHNPEEKNYKHHHAEVHNIYTNEHPDIFRLDGMKEGGYYNPFLNQIDKVDRSAYFKKLSLDRKNINFIDFIKSNKKYSQNPNIIRYISSDEEIALRRKRMGRINEGKEIKGMEQIHNRNRPNKNLSYTNTNSNFLNFTVLNEEGNKNKKEKEKEYNNLIKKLNFFIPKIDYKMKKTLNLTSDGNKSSFDENDNLYKKLSVKNLKLNNNLRNINTYQINRTFMSNDEISFNRKPISRFNPIRDRIDVIKPPPFKNGKWSPFLENYFLMENTATKFQRPGGLCSEFCNKNITSINNDKYEIQQKLKNEKNKKDEIKKKSPKKIILKK